MQRFPTLRSALFNTALSLRALFFASLFLISMSVTSCFQESARVTVSGDEPAQLGDAVSGKVTYDAFKHTPLKLISVTPYTDKKKLTENYPDLSVTLSFNQPMVELSQETQLSSLRSFIGFSTTVRMETRWIGTRTVRFTPVSTVAGDTLVMRIGKGLRAMSGQSLGFDTSMVFYLRPPPRRFATAAVSVFPQRATPTNPVGTMGKNELLWLAFEGVVPSANRLRVINSNTAEDLECSISSVNEARKQAAIGSYTVQGDSAAVRFLRSHPAVRLLTLSPRSGWKSAPYTLRLTDEYNADKHVADFFVPDGLLCTGWYHGDIQNDVRRNADTLSPQTLAVIEFSSEVTKEALLAALTIEPPVAALKLHPADSSLHFSTRYALELAAQPQIDYTVRIASTLRDRFDNPLQQERTLKLHIGDYAPQFSMPDNGMIETNGTLNADSLVSRFAVQSLNLDQMQCVQFFTALGDKALEGSVSKALSQTANIADINQPIAAALNARLPDDLTRQIHFEVEASNRYDRRRDAYTCFIKRYSITASGALTESGRDKLLKLLPDKSYQLAVLKLYEQSRVLTLKAALLKPDEIAKAAHGHHNPLDFKSVQTYRLPIEQVRNREVRHAFDLRQVFGSNTSGVAVLAADVGESARTGFGDKENPAKQSMVSLISMGLLTEASAKETRIFLYRLTDNSPVPNATVHLYTLTTKEAQTAQGDYEERLTVKQLWSGKTNADGMAVAPKQRITTEGYYDSPQLTLVATAGSDLAYSTPGTEAFDMPYSYDLGRTPPEPVQASVFTERDLYRAGETVFFKGVVRDRVAKAWRLPKLQSFELKITDAQRQEVFTKKVTVDKVFGTFADSMQLKADAKLGTYTLSVFNSNADALITRRFRVEAYRTATFEVKVRVPEKQMTVGDSVRATVEATYLFGAPLANAKVKWSIRSSSFTPSFLNEFKGSGGWRRAGEIKVKNVSVDSSGTLNEKGELEIVYRVDTSYASPATLTVEAEIEDDARRVISGRETVTLNRSEFYLGIAPEKIYAAAGTSLPFRLTAFSQQGKNISMPVLLEVRRAYPSGKDSLLSTQPVTTSDTGATVTGVVLPSVGTYRLRAVAKDRAGRIVETQTEVYAYGAGFTASSISITAEQDEYAADASVPSKTLTARLFVKSPFSKATALVTTEQDGNLITRRTAFESSDPFIEVPVSASRSGDLRVNVVLLKTRAGIGDTAAAVQASTTLSVAAPQRITEQQPSRALSVTLLTDRETYFIGETVEVKLRVKNAAGKGVRGEIALAAVDAGILNLTGYTLPNLTGSYTIYENVDDFLETELALSGLGFSPLAAALLKAQTESFLRPLQVSGSDIFYVDFNRRSEEDARAESPKVMASVGAAIESSVESMWMPMNSDGGLRGYGSGGDIGFGGSGSGSASGRGLSRSRNIDLTPDNQGSDAIRKLEDLNDDKAATARKIEELKKRRQDVDKEIRRLKNVENVTVRKAFAATLYWNPRITTDDSGVAVVRIPLKDNLTTFRLMASALTAETEFGTAQTDIIVTQPLTLTAALPRFTRIGDRFEAGVIVTNDAGKPASIQLTRSATGVQALGDSIQTLTLNSGESKEVRFKFIADREGKAKFKFIARSEMDNGSTQSDAGSGSIYTDGIETELPVQLPLTKETLALFATTTDSAAESVRIPKAIYPKLGELSVQASSSSLVGLREAAQYLFDYPYGCLEQQASRILPYIVAEDLVRNFKLKTIADTAKGGVRGVVERALENFEKYRVPGGGFDYWVGGKRADDYVSVYATYTMARAKASGYKVSEALYKNSLAYSRTVAERRDTLEYSYASLRTTRALALYTLALAGEPVASLLSSLVAEWEQLPVEAKAYVLRAATMQQRVSPATASRKGSAVTSSSISTDKIKALASSLMRLLRDDGRTAYFSGGNATADRWTFNSDVKTTATAFAALIDAGADNADITEKMTAWLMKSQKHGRWRSTQENIFVLDALNTYFRQYENVPPDFLVQIVFAGRAVMNESFKGYSLETKTAREPLGKFATGDELRLSIRKSGTGKLNYGARLSYYPTSLLKSADNGFSVMKTYTLNANTGGKPVRPQNGIWRVKAGETVTVTLTVEVFDEMHFVAANDPLPAGLEAIDPTLKTASAQTGDTNPNAQVGGRYKDYRWRPAGFEHIELRNDRVTLFATVLPRGVYTYTYQARALTYGTFTLPPTTAEEMYEPEVFGRTGSATLVVEK